ncbi:MAG: hypothetical protein NTW67_06305, partial [Candidatus Woesearchaeota archaeon]|nr:hypothetical protein [Candidatus Woesearchaeota archaeon]
ELIKGTQIHEMAHLVYSKFYGSPKFDNDKGTKETEIFALLTELKNKNHDSIYLSFATICFPKGFISGKACNEILGLFFSEMYNNQSEYPNISFEKFDIKKQNVDVLVPQVLQLSVDQIQGLAAKSFIRSFPEMNKLYNPAGK